jgi:hypothetical protein
MKRLMGKTDAENAFQSLDTLTKEENLMTAARTFEATHDINDNVKATDKKVTAIEEVLQHVDGNIRVTQELTYDVHADVGVIKEGTRSVDDNVKVTKRGTPIVSVSCNVLASHILNQQLMKYNVCYSLMLL